MKYYHKNMGILKRNYRNIYDKVVEYEISGKVKVNEVTNQGNIIAIINDKENNFNIYIESTRTDSFTMRIETEERDIYFHSKYAPLKEAVGLIKNFKVKKQKQVIALGFGLGYHLNELASRNQYDRIIIIEPYMSIFFTALNFVDLSSLLKNKRLFFIVEGNIKIFDVINRYISLSIAKELSFLEQAPSVKLFNSEYKNIYQEIKEAVNYKKTSLATDIQQARKWRNNIILNIPYIFENPKADDFFGSFQGVPAVCISAGPSLDKNIDQVKRAEGKALIMCVGTALKALLKHNIQPDIVVSIDGRIANYRHFEDIMDIPDSFLFADLGNHYQIQQKWNDKQVFFTMKRNFSGWVEKIKGEYTSIRTGGTVAHSMVDLAYRFGADPIILVGQDLAYEDGKTHASGTTYEGNKAEKNKLLEVEGIAGNTIYTSKVFMTMISYFNNYFSKRPNRTYIDATEGGARIQHTIIMRLEDVVDKYIENKNGFNVREILNNKFNTARADLVNINSILLDQIKDSIDELNKAISITEKQLSRIRLLENQFKKGNEISDEDISKIKQEYISFEKQLKELNYVKFFIERILIIESMKYEEVKGKYYISKRQEFEEIMKYYRTYRVNYLRELEQGRNLIMEVYNNYNLDTNKDKISNGEGIT